MEAVRSGLDRYLSSSPFRKPFSIIRDCQFKKANEVLDAHLKSLARKGVIGLTVHKKAIFKEDLEKLYEEKQLGDETPEALLQTAWFNTIYFGKRGRENQRAMRPEGFEFSKTAYGLEFAVLKKRATKITRVDLKITRMKAVQRLWNGLAILDVQF